jgi:hypothetical protein
VYVGNQLLTFSSKPQGDRFCERLAERIAEDMGDSEFDLDGLASQVKTHDLSVTDFLDVTRREPKSEWTMGEKKLLVVVMDWQFGDRSKPPLSSQTKTPDHYEKRVFPQVAEAFHTMSYGRLTLDVTVVPDVIRFKRRRARYTAIGYPYPGLYLGAKESLEGDAAHGENYRFDDYDLVYVITPQQQPLGTHGVSWVGAKGAICNGCEELGEDSQVMVAVHELGHNLGLGHAASQSLEYGNVFDWMGNYPGIKSLSLSVGFRHKLRWIPTDAVATLTDQDLPDLNYEYHLKPFDRDEPPHVGDLVGIHIRLGSHRRDLYVAYRRGGEDREDGIYLTWQDRLKPVSQLVDAGCHTPSQRDAALLQGWTYMDPAFKVVIYIHHISKDVATVHVFRPPSESAVDAIRSRELFTDGQSKCPRTCTDSDIKVAMYEGCGMLAHDGYCRNGEVSMGGKMLKVKTDLCPKSCDTCNQALAGSSYVDKGCADRDITINGLPCTRAAAVGYCDAMTNLGNVGRDLCMKSCGYCSMAPRVRARNTSDSFQNPAPGRSFGAQDENAEIMPVDSAELILESQMQEEEDEEKYAADHFEGGYECVDDPQWMDLDGDTCEVYASYIKSGKLSVQNACNYNGGEATHYCRRTCESCGQEEHQSCKDKDCVMKWQLEYGKCFRCDQRSSFCGDKEFAEDCPRTCGLCQATSKDKAEEPRFVPQTSPSPKSTTTEPAFTVPPPCKDSDCVDHWLKETEECYKCHDFAETFCGRDEEFTKACPRSCKMCSTRETPACEDNFSPHTCRRFAAWQWCTSSHVAEHCRASCGMCPKEPEEEPEEDHDHARGKSAASPFGCPGVALAALMTIRFTAFLA